MESQYLDLPMLILKGQLKTICNAVNVGHGMSVDSDQNNSESIREVNVLFARHLLKLDLEN